MGSRVSSIVRAGDYARLISEISVLLQASRRAAARAINRLLAPTYWDVGRRIVEFEQGGKARAAYGDELLARLATDLSAKYGRGFSPSNLSRMRAFFSGWEISQTPSAQLQARAICATPSQKSGGPGKVATPSRLFQGQTGVAVDAFPLSWSQYVRLMTVENPRARAFYEAEAIRGGWSVRELDRQVSTQFFERVIQAKDPEKMLQGAQAAPKHELPPVEAEVRDPYLLEFLDLKDEYSEADLEEALIRHLERFLLELGAGFAFVARQKRIRVGDSWHRMDLLLYHRGLRCLVVIDLKRGAFSQGDAGQMNLYLNYAREHLTMPGEADPVGIILCTDKDDAVVRYATGGIRAQVFASKYLVYLPEEETLRKEIMTTQRALQARRPA